MLPILILIRPLDLKSGQRVDIRLGSAAEPTAHGLNNQFWEPAIARRPRIAQDLMSLDLDGKFKLAAADFIIALNQLDQHINPGRLYWAGAPVTIWSVEQLDWNRRVVEFDGLVTGAPADRVSRKLTINATVDRARIDKPLLTKEFNADGQAGGGPEMRGRPYPAGFGYVENVEWVLFDSINNIGMLDGYGNLIDVLKAMEGASDLGASMGDFLTYADLKLAVVNGTIVPGRWGTCLREGMVALGAPPAGRITFIAQFGQNLSGAIMKRILRVHAGVPDSDVMLGSFDVLDAAAPYEVRAHFSDQVDCSAVIEAMCWPLNATPLVTVQNKIAVTLSNVSVAVGTINLDGSTLPTVTNARTADPIEPIWRVIYRVERPAVTLGYDEVNYADDLIDRGLWSNQEVYRQGHMVWLEDKSQWLYVNEVPTKGHKPGDPNDADAYWQNLQPPTDATTIFYPSGKSVASLEPAQKGADVTGENTSKDTAAVGGREAAALLGTIDINTEGLLAAALRQDDYYRVMEARTHVDGKPTDTYFLEFKNEQKTVNEAVNTRFSLLGARTPDGTGWILNMATVQVGNGRTLAQRLEEIGVSNGEVTGKITELREIQISQGKKINATVGLELDVNGYVSGYRLNNDGKTASMTIVADKFAIVSQDGGAPIVPFRIVSGTVFIDRLVATSITYDSLVQRFTDVGRQNLDPNGWYQEIPGGLIMMGGRYRQQINREVSLTVLFPKPFPTQVLSVGVVPHLNAYSAFRDLWLQTLGEPTLRGFSCQTQAASSDNMTLDGFDWWAWGR